MRMINLSDLPACPGKTGWPWDIPLQSPQPANFPWPRISIVTPSFNQAQFLEETIRSVLLQGYPNLEYILMDGGSTDGSLEIIKKYSPWLTFWTSAKDNGQSAAINAGFSHATGELAGWLNSDDIYFPGALCKVAQAWVNQGKPSSLVSGERLEGDSQLKQITHQRTSPNTIPHLLDACIFEQPATFFPLELFIQVQGLDLSYSFALDYDLWLRMTRQGAGILSISEDLAVTRLHAAAKSSRHPRRSALEGLRSVWMNYHLLPETWVKKFLTALIVPPVINSKVTEDFLLIIRNLTFRLSRSLLILFHILKPETP